MRFRYSDEHLAFLRENYPRMVCPDLVAAFNLRFSLNMTYGQIKSCLSNYRIVGGRKPMKGRHLSYSPEQVSFLKEAYKRLPLPDLHAAFVAKFGPIKTKAQLRYFVHNNRIPSGRTGQFEKGSEPPNKGVKGWQAGGRSVETQFKPGHGGTNTRPMYSERICSKDGFILIKVPEPNPYTGAPSRFKHKHVWVWEQAHGPIPAGKVVSFIDGDKLNCSLENLELITRAELLMMNARHAPKDIPDELRPAARTIAKLKASVGRRRREVEEKSA